MTRPPVRSTQLLYVHVAAWLAGTLIVVVPLLASLPDLTPLGALVALVGLLATLASRGSPAIALGALAVTAWFSKPTIEIAGVNIRVEQPTLLLLAGMLVFSHRRLLLLVFRQLRLATVGLGIWLGALLVSSLLIAPDPIPSVRIVVWTGMSVAACFIAAILVIRMPARVDPTRILIVAAGVQAVLVLLAALSGRVFGVYWGGYEWLEGVAAMRATGLAWEPNILASGLAALVPVAFYQYRRTGHPIVLGAIVIMGVALWLSLTRSAWAALAVVVAGLVVREVWLRWHGHARGIHLMVSITALAVGLASGVVTSALTNSTDRGILGPAPRALPTPAAVQTPRASAGASGSAPTQSQGSLPASPVEGGPTAPPRPLVPVDLADAGTLEFRLERARLALSDLESSPLIGLGASTFEQRHLDPTQQYRPDSSMGMFPLTVLYDSGIVGLIGLALFLASLIQKVLAIDDRELGYGLLAGFVILGLSYMLTDALRFGQNWILFGVAFGLSLRRGLGQSPGGRLDIPPIAQER